MVETVFQNLLRMSLMGIGLVWIWNAIWCFIFRTCMFCCVEVWLVQAVLCEIKCISISRFFLYLNQPCIVHDLNLRTDTFIYNYIHSTLASFLSLNNRFVISLFKDGLLDLPINRGKRTTTASKSNHKSNPLNHFRGHFYFCLFPEDFFEMYKVDWMVWPWLFFSRFP